MLAAKAVSAQPHRGRGSSQRLSELGAGAREHADGRATLLRERGEVRKEGRCPCVLGEDDRRQSPRRSARVTALRPRQDRGVRLLLALLLPLLLLVPSPTLWFGIFRAGFGHLGD